MAKQKITIEWEGNNINCSYNLYPGTSSIEVIGILEFVKLDVFTNKQVGTKEEKDNEVQASEENLR